LLGHTQASTTHRYAHLLDEPQRTATEAFATRIARADKDEHCAGDIVEKRVVTKTCSGAPGLTSTLSF
jgi:hypothetical protein